MADVEVVVVVASWRRDDDLRSLRPALPALFAAGRLIVDQRLEKQDDG